MTATITEALTGGTDPVTVDGLGGLHTCRDCGRKTVAKTRWSALAPEARARLATQGIARRGTVALCHTCYVRDRRLNPQPSGPGRLTPMERVEQATRTCDTCGRRMAPRGAWDTLDPADRARLTATHTPATRTGTCRACGDAARQRRRTPPDPATLATVGACHTCGTTLIRRTAWEHWPATTKSQWRQAGYAPEIPDKAGICGPCARHGVLAAANQARHDPNRPRGLSEPGANRWMSRAWCADTSQVLKAGLDPDWWTESPSRYLPSAIVDEHHQHAAQACRTRCPVVAECLASQLALEMPGARVGVWGGTTPTDRTHITQDQEAS